MPSASTKNGWAQSDGEVAAGAGVPPASVAGAGCATSGGPPAADRLLGAFAGPERIGFPSAAIPGAWSSGRAVASGDVAVRLVFGLVAGVAGPGA